MKCRMFIPLVCCSLLVGACAPVATYPARGDNAVSNDPNVAPMPAVVAAALSRAVRLYPVDGQYIINLPEGQSLKTAQRIHRDIGDEDGFLISSNAMKYPVYHVDRIWVRGDNAQVEVLCPIWPAGTSLDTPAYEREYRRVIFNLEGAFDAWSVSGVRSFDPGLVEPPQLYGWQ